MNDIKMNEIDPKLFVTCRLCLDNTGVYQIVPSVQKQIKFCYEIEVDPFDGLPQLICRDCESTLRTYFELKTKYTEKQEKLRERLQLQTATPQTSAVQPEDENVTVTQHNEANSKKRKRVLSICDSDTSIAAGSVKSKDNLEKRSKRKKEAEPPNILELGYNNWFICRFCNFQCRSRSEIIRHVNNLHKSIKQKYVNLIKRECYVKLDKFDGKPNICNSDRYVVLSSDKITHLVHMYYYVVMRPKDYCDTQRPDRDSLPDDNNLNSTDVSEDEIMSKGCQVRRRRILSNETVVIEKSSSREFLPLEEQLTQDVNPMSIATRVNDTECISIDDSDTESLKSNDVSKNDDANLNSSVNNREYKTIYNIITQCFKRHLKRLEDTTEADVSYSLIQPQNAKLDSLLKHKVLSIGKKMINSSSFSCTGILRFLEHQNLEIKWTPKILKYANKKSDCVRIMMKLKSREENDSHELGWEILEDTNHVNESSNDCRPIEDESSQNIDETSNDRVEMDSAAEIDAEHPEGRTASSANKVCPDKMLKKLLNENPVSNPKTLPKKSRAPKFPITRKKKRSKDDKAVAVGTHNGETMCNMLLPVITSTISLASVNGAEKQPEHNGLPSVSSEISTEHGSEASVPVAQEATANSEQLEPVGNLPRIKVKSASQLMTDTAFNNIEQQIIQQTNMFAQNQNVNMPYQNNGNVVYMKKTPVTKVNNTVGYEKENLNVTPQTLIETNPQTSVPMHENSTREYVVLHSVVLPHTKTTSPFAYFKRLLQINDIYLLNPEEIMTADFITILKFKIVFQQETTSPIVLCLAIFNCRNRFCLKIKDVYNKELNILQLSPNWQWEILRVCSGDVVTKMLCNAQKISAEVFDYTRKFLAYLNSIELRN